MKITVNRKSFADALTEIAPFCPQKGTIAILRYAKITTKGNRLKIEGNDTQSSIRKYIFTEECDMDGSFLVECDSLAKFVAKTKGDTLVLESDGDTLVVKHPKGTADFQLLPVEEYPSFDMQTEDATTISMPASMLSDCVALAKGFVGTDDLRPQMKAIYAYVKDGEFGYCATDTRMLINNHSPLDVAEGCDTHWFIESFVFNAIIKACKNNGDASISITPTHVSYRIGDTVIQTVQTKGNYPDFNRVIPKSHSMECVADKMEIMDSISRVSLFCDNMRLIKLGIGRMDMTVSANNTVMLKSSTETLQHDGCNGEIIIGVQADYFSTCLNAYSDGSLLLQMTDASRPILVRQEAMPNMVVLLMPMTIN